MPEHKKIDYSNNYILSFDENNAKRVVVQERDTFTPVSVYFDSPTDTIINLNFAGATPHLVLRVDDLPTSWVKVKGKFTANNKAEFTLPVEMWEALREKSPISLMEQWSLRMSACVLIEYEGLQMVLPPDKFLDVHVDLTLEGKYN